MTAGRREAMAAAERIRDQRGPGEEIAVHLVRTTRERFASSSGDFARTQSTLGSLQAVIGFGWKERRLDFVLDDCGPEGIRAALALCRRSIHLGRPIDTAPVPPAAEPCQETSESGPALSALADRIRDSARRPWSGQSAEMSWQRRDVVYLGAGGASAYTRTLAELSVPGSLLVAERQAGPPAVIVARQIDDLATPAHWRVAHLTGDLHSAEPAGNAPELTGPLLLSPPATATLIALIGRDPALRPLPTGTTVNQRGGRLKDDPLAPDGPLSAPFGCDGAASRPRILPSAGGTVRLMAGAPFPRPAPTNLVLASDQDLGSADPSADQVLAYALNGVPLLGDRSGEAFRISLKAAQLRNGRPVSRYRPITFRSTPAELLSRLTPLSDTQGWQLGNEVAAAQSWSSLDLSTIDLEEVPA